jgi:hypothetical protein
LVAHAVELGVGLDVLCKLDWRKGLVSRDPA